MKYRVLYVAATIVMLASGSFARAGQTHFSFGGAVISGSGTLTYGVDSVAGDPAGAYAITGISGTFSDAKLGLVDVAITGLVPINPISPSLGAPYPVSMSYYSVKNPHPPDASLSYDNLYYPGGSPITCAGYPGAGGFLDVYGVMFTLANGDVVDFWSNGTFTGGPPLSYGAAVVDSTSYIRDFQSAVLGMSVPEPGSLGLMATGLIGALAVRLRRRSAARRDEAISAV